MTAPPFERLALIGVGLIGSSIARAARASASSAASWRPRVTARPAGA